MMNDLQLLFRLDTGSVTARRAPVPLLEVASFLLRNAIAYGDPPIRLLARRRDDLVEIVVQDSGPGIPPELEPDLFGRFVRGAGLGLFIVRHLVAANGGSVRYERAEPRGARLIVTLEIAAVRG